MATEMQQAALRALADTAGRIARLAESRANFAARCLVLVARTARDATMDQPLSLGWHCHADRPVR